MVVAERRGCSTDSSAHFGDLIGGSVSTLLCEGAAQLAPAERLLVTANGNLQRLVSSWNNRPVEVRVLRNDRVDAADDNSGAMFDRIVELPVCACVEVEPRLSSGHTD